MVVMLVHHLHRLVAQQRGNDWHRQAAGQRVCRERVPQHVGGDTGKVRDLLPLPLILLLLAKPHDFLTQALESAADAVSSPGSSNPIKMAGAAEQRPLWVGGGQFPGQLLHRWRQVDYPRLARLAVGLVLVEGPPRSVAGDVLSGDLHDFRRPAAGIEHGEDELPELLVADEAIDVLALLGGQHAVAAFLGWLLDGPERVSGQQPRVVDRPVKHALEGDDGVSASPFPAQMLVQPFAEGERRKGGGGGSAEALHKRDDEIAVELVGFGVVVSLAVVEELLSNLGDGEPFALGGGKLFSLFQEPVAIGAVGLCLGLAQALLDAARNLEISGFLGLAIPRFRQRH
jgi:hypothetical protein